MTAIRSKRRKYLAIPLVAILLCLIVLSFNPQSDGEIDIDVDSTHHNQLQELNLVANVFADEFGKKFVLDNGQSWSIDAYGDAHAPVPCHSSDRFHHSLYLNTSGVESVGEMEEKTRSAAERLGYPDIGEAKESVHGEDRFVILALWEGRFLRVTKEGDSLRLVYSAPCSADESLEIAYEEAS